MHDAIPLVDVRAAYLAQRAELDAAVTRVVGAGGFILGPSGGVRGRLRELLRRPAGGRGGLGTAAIHLALAALGVGPGDEVATVAHTFTASAEAIVHAGARPRFVDVDEATGGMDPKALAGAVEGTAAVLPVHLYGLLVDMPQVQAVADDAGVPVVEDAAQAHGATLTTADGRVRRAGAAGRLAAFSFYPGRTSAPSATPARSPPTTTPWPTRWPGSATTAGPPSTSTPRSAGASASTPSRRPCSGSS